MGVKIPQFGPPNTPLLEGYKVFFPPEGGTNKMQLGLDSVKWPTVGWVPQRSQAAEGADFTPIQPLECRGRWVVPSPTLTQRRAMQYCKAVNVWRRGGDNKR